MTKCKLHLIQSSEGVARAARLAEAIWREYYTDILGKAQVDYMLAHLQSAEAIRRQIMQEAYCYFLIGYDGDLIGYAAVQEQEESLFLSKLYLLHSARGKGAATQVLSELERMAHEKGLPRIWLTVNRNNRNSIAIYQKKGFRILREEAAPIGGGFVMDDYIMEKELDEEAHGS